MRKEIVFKSSVSKVHPAVGSKEEGPRRRLRTLRTFSFELSPKQIVTLAAQSLAAAELAQTDSRFKKISVTVRRSDGAVTISGVGR